MQKKEIEAQVEFLANYYHESHERPDKDFLQHIKNLFQDQEMWWANRVWAVYQSGQGQAIQLSVSGRQGGRMAFDELVKRARKTLDEWEK